MLFLLSLQTAFAGDVVLTSRTAPGVLDLTTTSYTVALDDPKFDPAAFVVHTEGGDVVLDELLAAVGSTSAKIEVGFKNNASTHMNASWSDQKSATVAVTCYVVFGKPYCFAA